MEIIFYMSCAFLLAVFLVSTVLALRGNQAAKYFLRVWVALMVLVPPLMNRVNMISHIVAGLILVFFLYALYITVRYGMECVDVSHEETRRVLAGSNRYIDEEQHTLARHLHDEVNSQFLLTRSVLKQLEPPVAGNGQAVELPGNASGMLNDAYAGMRDIIKNTRVRVIDSIGFAAALESLVTHYTDTSGKPAIALKHNLSKRSMVPEAPVINAYGIIREAILNAIEHSKAAQVRVSIHHNRALDTYKVETTDDGVGIKATARSGEYAGTGLIDICERVRVLGGALKIQAADSASQKRPGMKLSFSFSG